MVKRSLYIFIVCIVVSACNLPLFRNEDSRFFIEPEVIEAITPYLARWSTLPPEQTEDERARVTQENASILRISIGQVYSKQGTAFQVVYILLEIFGDWYRGALYIHNKEADLNLPANLEWRQIDDHFYVYNYND